MENNKQIHPSKENIFFYLLVLGLFESMATILSFFIIPADPENAIFLGLSQRRWALIGIIFLIGIFQSAIAFLWLRSLEFRQGVKALVTNPVIYFIATITYSTCLLVTALFLVMADNQVKGILERLLPVVILCFFLSLQVAIWQITQTKGQIRLALTNLFMTFSQRSKVTISKLSQQISAALSTCVLWFDHPRRSVLLILIIGSFPLFYNALRFQWPLGYSGLYALMAELIAQNNFELPKMIPFYGPGGLPFAYPPLGPYLMAVCTDLIGIPAWTYLRFSAPVLSFLALIPLYLFAHELTHRRVAASIAVIIVAFSPRVYLAHTFAAGMVRGLAFVFMLFALYYYTRAIRNLNIKDYLLSGLFFGFTLLTHWSYAEFFVFAAIIFGLSQFRWDVIIKSLAVAIIGGGIALPWFLLLIQRIGPAFILGAFTSHGNDHFLHNLGNINQLLAWMAEYFSGIAKEPLLAGTILLGNLLLLARRQIQLPLLFLVTLIFTSEGDRFLVLTGGIIVGDLVNFIWQNINLAYPNKLEVSLSFLEGGMFILLLTLCIAISGFTQIAQMKPTISASTVELADFIKQTTDPRARYLATESLEEDEWLPYLFQRTPSAAHWGSEWTGNYQTQISYLYAVQNCIRTQDAYCLQKSIENIKVTPDFLITIQQLNLLTEALSASGQWHIVYFNERYILWQKR